MLVYVQVLLEQEIHKIPQKVEHDVFIFQNKKRM